MIYSAANVVGLWGVLVVVRDGARSPCRKLSSEIALDSSYCFGIDRAKLLKLVALRISDRRVLKLLRQWLGGGCTERG
jgi:hypothetical protein